jgi:uncharacterized membrane protein YdjX (TVP38/TMEM64 family)
MTDKPNKIWIRYIIFAAVLILGIGTVFLWGDPGLWWERGKEIFSSREAIERYVEQWGLWAPVVFVLIQAAQVILAPIPGNVTALAGGALFGWGMGFLLSSLGLVIGSMIAFWLGRFFGKPLVVRMVGPRTYERYEGVVVRKGIWVLFLIFLIPFFPDDALCLLAGMTAISFPLFTLLVVVGRLPGMLVANLAGSGLISLTIWQWAIVAVVCIGLAVFVFKFREKIETYLYTKFKLNR